jgi:membrane protease YdiL (CAAX protease family)
MPNAQAAIVIMMLTTSAEIWWQWRRRHRETGAIWSKSDSPNVPINVIAVLLTLMMIGLSAYSAFSPTRSELNEEKLYSISNVWLGCAINGVIVVMLLPIVSEGQTQILAQLGFRLTNWRRQFLDGMQTALASFLPVMLMLFVTSPVRTADATHPLLKLLQQDGQFSIFVAIVCAAVLFAPLAEELMFRVVLLGWLKTQTNSTAAIVISSVAFAAVHGPLDGIALFPLALLLGFRGSRVFQFNKRRANDVRSLSDCRRASRLCPANA